MATLAKAEFQGFRRTDRRTHESKVERYRSHLVELRERAARLADALDDRLNRFDERRFDRQEAC